MAAQQQMSSTSLPSQTIPSPSLEHTSSRPHQNLPAQPPVRSPSPIHPPPSSTYSTTVISPSSAAAPNGVAMSPNDHDSNLQHEQQPLSPPSDPASSTVSEATLDSTDDADDSSSDTDPNSTSTANSNSTTYDPDAAGVEFVVLHDEVLTSVANATLVLLDGSDLERLAVLFQFPQFLEHCPTDTLQIMVPEICRDAVRWKEEVQMAAAEALYFVVNMRIPETVAKRIVIAALRIIQMSESGDVFDAWGEILSMMLPQVKREDVLSLVVPATVDRASSSTVESRRLAARIIGSLNDALTAKELEEQFLGQAMRLCDDVDASVRAMIAQSLASVGSKLPLRISERQLWPKLDTLMGDENARVRAASMRAVARSAEAHKNEALTSPSFTNMLLPIFLRECANASTVASSDLRTVDDDTYLMLEIFSEVYGYLLCAVHPLFEYEETWNTALNALRRMVTCNGPTVRHWCAFNIPAVSLVCGERRPDKIRGVVHALSADTDVETRATLAAGIHETARVLGNGELRDEVLGAIANLMTDQNPQVRMNSLAHFAELLTLLAAGPSSTSNGNVPNGNGTLNDNMKKRNISSSSPTTPNSSGGIGDGKVNPNSKDSPARELAPVFQSLETMSHDSWRTQELLAQQIDQCADKIPQDMLCEHVAPLLFQMARESTYLVRRASISALISVVRYIPDVRRRDHILRHFRSEWARGKVYWTRLAYIDGSTVALKVLSNRLFTHLFASELLSLSRDPVANVRLRLTRLMPAIAVACGTKTTFKAAMETLTEDEDEEIRREAEIMKDKISKMNAKTVVEESENSKKEAAEKKFFIQRAKRKTNSGTKDNSASDGTGAGGTTTANGSSGSTNGRGTTTEFITGTMRRNTSFTNTTDATVGAKPTVVTHSALGAAGSVAPDGNNIGNTASTEHLAAVSGGMTNVGVNGHMGEVDVDINGGLGNGDNRIGDRAKRDMNGEKVNGKKRGSRIGCCFS